jgi:hypothetical protein
MARCKCGHTNTMHDERGCVALSCLCNGYTPTQDNVRPFVQPPRQPLNARTLSHVGPVLRSLSRS